MAHERTLWVIEQDLDGQWYPTTSVAHHRSKGLLMLEKFQGKNKDHPCRLFEYIAADRATDIAD